MPLDPGAMRHQVRIEQRSTTQDASGDPLPSWVPFAIRRCAISRMSGREVFSSEERQGRIPTVFHLRYLDGVMPAMRAILPAVPPKQPKDRVFNILSAVDPDGMRAELLITAEELVEAIP